MKEDDAVFENSDEPVSDKETVRLQYLERVIERELDFCMRLNKYQARNYYMWSYRLKLVRDILIKITKKHVSFKENLILKEMKDIQAYMKQNPKDLSAVHYFEEIKRAMDY